MRHSREVRERLSSIEESLHRLDVAIITRYPDSERAADAYEALRKGVMTIASAGVMFQQNLIALVNALDEGATPETIRYKISDLLSTQSIRELSIDDLKDRGSDEMIAIFQEVGDQAHPRSAWVRISGDKMEVVQRGYVAKYPERPVEIPVEAIALETESPDPNDMNVQLPPENRDGSALAKNELNQTTETMGEGSSDTP